jgi:heme/copper-type cytochrome/quinol oxidase subunit 1
MFIGFNLTFFPMHYLGMIGQPRRTHSYNEGHGFETWNQIATIGAFILGVGIVIGVYQFFSAFFNKKLKDAGKTHGMPEPLNGLFHLRLKNTILPVHQLLKVEIRHGKIIMGPRKIIQEKCP